LQFGLGKKQDLISKITKAKSVGGATQVVDHLPCKLDALSLTLTKKRKEKKKTGEAVEAAKNKVYLIV
jgi:hypothetical protein